MNKALIRMSYNSIAGFRGKYMKQIFCYASLLVMLSACAATPAANNTRVSDQQLSMIQQDYTSEQEVIQLLGRPTSITVTPKSRTLLYSYNQNNNIQRQVVSSGAAAVGGFVAGPLGSLAGGVLGGSVMPTNQLQEQVSIEIDPVTYRVMNFQRQQTTTYQ